jgi:hypothetical protein
MCKDFGGINFKFQPAKWHQDPHSGTMGEGIRQLDTH